MASIRTHNNRRRSRRIKRGNLYKLHYSKRGPSWADLGWGTDQIAEDIAGALGGSK